MDTLEKSESLNVFGEPLEICGEEPKTGFFRDGCCNTGENDSGSHTICSRLTSEFLNYSKSQGNDLSTPRPEFGFPGLKPGDTWCLCAARWLEAFNAGVAPRVFLSRTHIKALDIVSLKVLRQYALDLN